MNNNCNKRRNVFHRQTCERACALCTDEGLISYLQMYSTGVCYVLFRWDMAWGGGGCSVLCSTGQRATVQRESELGVRGP